ncbi:hypothetical protein CALCODRAFT_478676 [Calocera cornea HHB12733]|uniref:Uncharacterized protein n=1 Tax=Calocera cornea HHB12733 TaxID=1353952 RepID=A0A165K6F4_9BASI|nr:hypothetical protein CALCODRAFT_478676 [Calocera cornea HHB12733]
MAQAGPASSQVTRNMGWMILDPTDRGNALRFHESEASPHCTLVLIEAQMQIGMEALGAAQWNIRQMQAWMSMRDARRPYNVGQILTGPLNTGNITLKTGNIAAEHRAAVIAEYLCQENAQFGGNEDEDEDDDDDDDSDYEETGDAEGNEEEDNDEDAEGEEE